MGKRTACPLCRSFNIHIWIAGRWQCKDCRKTFLQSEKISIEYVPANPRPSTRARADVQERRVAKQVGGRQTIASGQTPVDKADVKISGELRIECKTTEKKSYGLKREDLTKLQAQAKDDEIPVLMVEFTDPTSSEFAVLTKDWFLQLLDTYRANK